MGNSAVAAPDKTGSSPYTKVCLFSNLYNHSGVLLCNKDSTTLATLQTLSTYGLKKQAGTTWRALTVSANKISFSFHIKTAVHTANQMHNNSHIVMKNVISQVSGTG